MKKLLFIIPILISCSTPQTIVKAVKSVNISANDTIITIDTIQVVSTAITRQERKLIKDSLKHVEKMANIERKIIKDSIRWEYKIKVIEKVRFKDSIRWVTKQVQSDNKKDVKIKRIESNIKWWVWLIVASLILSLILNVVLLIIRR